MQNLKSLTETNLSFSQNYADLFKNNIQKKLRHAEAWLFGFHVDCKSCSWHHWLNHWSPNKQTICFTPAKHTAQRKEKSLWLNGCKRLRVYCKFSNGTVVNTWNISRMVKPHLNQCQISHAYSQYMWSTFFVVSAMLSFILDCTTAFSFVLNVSEPQFQYTDRLSSSSNWNNAHYIHRLQRTVTNNIHVQFSPDSINSRITSTD